MAFNSLPYIAFFAIVAVINFLIPGRFRWLWLLASSLFFYAYAGPIYVLQILAATAVSYYAAIRIETQPEKPQKQQILTIVVLTLVANLFAFKYVSFLNETLRSTFGLVGAHYPVGC